MRRIPFSFPVGSAMPPADSVNLLRRFPVRQAAAVGINGIFMEVHPQPEKALSDGPNSLDFANAEKVLDQVLAIYELTRKMQ